MKKEKDEELNDTKYEIYRKSKIGKELENSLDELGEKINDDLREEILNQFDKSIFVALKEKVKHSLILKVKIK
jgi:hypothetical protein